MRRSQHQSDEATDGEMRLIALHEQGIHTVSVEKGIDRGLKQVGVLNFISGKISNQQVSLHLSRFA